jgi:hypothetical protein
LISDRRNSWGFSLFCDDLRLELGGKISVMGIYQAEMVFPQNMGFPLSIPKLCIFIKYYEVPGSLTDDLEVRIFVPGDGEDIPSVVMPFPRAVIESTRVDTIFPLEGDQERVHNMTFPVTLSPFTIKQKGWIKVRIVCGGLVTNMGSLMVRTAYENENLFPA